VSAALANDGEFTFGDLAARAITGIAHRDDVQVDAA